VAVAVRSNESLARSDETSDAGRLFEEHSKRLFGYCLGVLGSRAEAEDAVQTTYLYAHRALQRGVVPEFEYAWLHTIAGNVCRWQLRTLARRGSLSTDLDLDEFPSKLDDGSESRELRMQLEDALAAIPESQRRALVLREWHGLSSHEVASRLGMSTTATYALITRARRSLARAMTTARRPVLGFDLGSLLCKLRELFAGGTAKVVATTAAAGSVAIGGIAVERIVVGDGPSRTPVSGATVEAVRDVGPSAPITAELARGAARPANVRPSSGDVVRPSGAAPARSSPSSPASHDDPVAAGQAGPATGAAEPPSAPSGTPGDAEPVPTAPVEIDPQAPLEQAVLDDPSPLVEDLVEPLPLDEVELPQVELPQVELPLVEISTDELVPPALDGDTDLEDVLSDPLSELIPPALAPLLP
jgi:RNA polymerase sigma factor (sigma-70 family)